jgi:ABC-type spermidine/putrescine transport system permease subunit II
VQVQKPTFDLVGVVLSSLGLAGICAIVAFVLGVAFGLTAIVRRRRGNGPLPACVSLHLLQ